MEVSMTRFSIVLLLGLGAFAQVGVQAQGSDCSNAVAISEQGTFAYDTTSGGASNFGTQTSCNPVPFGLTDEGYFQWTAVMGGNLRFSIDSPGGDRQLALYSGSGCTATCLHYGFPVQGPGGTERAIDFYGVLPGETLLIQIANTTGLANSGPGGVGTFRIEPIQCGGTVLPVDPFPGNDDCSTAANLAPGIYSDLWYLPDGADYFEVDVPQGQVVTIAYNVQAGIPSVVLVTSICTFAHFPQAGYSLANMNGQPTSIKFRVAPATSGECGVFGLEVTSQTLPCIALAGIDDPFEENDDCTEPRLIGAGFYAGLNSSLTDTDHFMVDVPPLHGIQVSTMGVTGPVDTSQIRTFCSSLCGGTTLEEYFNNDPVVPKRVYFCIQPDSTVGLFNECALYDMTIRAGPIDCAAMSPDIFDLGGADGLSNGFYANLFLGADPLTRNDSYLVCVQPGAQASISVNRTSFKGLILGDLYCQSEPSCLQGPPLQSAMGPDMLFQWTNTANVPREFRLNLRKPPSDPDCSAYSLTVTGVGGCGELLATSNFCSPAAPNSTTQPVWLMAAQDTQAPGGPNVALAADSGPAGAFAFALVGTWSLDPGVQISQGFLCLSAFSGNRVGRYNRAGTPFDSVGSFDALGRWATNASNGLMGYGFDLPATTPWGGSLQFGNTLYFQLWYRDGQGESNFSNGVAIRF